MWEVMAAVCSAAAVLLGIVILFRLPKNQNDGVTYDQLRRGMAEQSNDTMRQLSLLKQELDTAMKKQQPVDRAEHRADDPGNRPPAGRDAGYRNRSIRTLQEDNAKKLDSMRQTVDEKLTVTLEKRLGESFHTVSEQLKKVYEGLGKCRLWPPGWAI